jgi:tRNA threonylcarbamoyladenosine biosynthesis protein TsaB
MKLLAIETATRLVGCGLWDEGGPVAANLLVAGQRHVEVLVPAIDALCRQAGISVADLDAVAVDIGPGLFTGLRVGLATATTIATARNIPAVGVTSLEALAHPHRRRPGPLAAVIDARRGEVYWALFEGDGLRHKELRAPSVASPQDAANEIGNVLAVGDGAVRYRDIFEAAGSEVAGPGDMWPSPLAVAELGMERIAGATLGPGAAFEAGGLPSPLYLRQADVRIGWDQVDGRVGGPTSSASGEPKLAR